MSQISAVGIPWYSREDYGLVVRLMKDGHRLPPSFEQWLDNAQQLHDRLQSKGLAVFKAYIKPESFVLWCRAHGKDLDADGRKAFAAAEARRRVQEG